MSKGRVKNHLYAVGSLLQILNPPLDKGERTVGETQLAKRQVVKRLEQKKGPVGRVNCICCDQAGAMAMDGEILESMHPENGPGAFGVSRLDYIVPFFKVENLLALDACHGVEGPLDPVPVIAAREFIHLVLTTLARTCSECIDQEENNPSAHAIPV